MHFRSQWRYRVWRWRRSDEVVDTKSENGAENMEIEEELDNEGIENVLPSFIELQNQRLKSVKRKLQKKR